MTDASEAFELFERAAELGVSGPRKRSSLRSRVSIQEVYVEDVTRVFRHYKAA